MDDLAFLIVLEDDAGKEYCSLSCGSGEPLTTGELREATDKALARHAAIKRSPVVTAASRQHASQSPQEYVAWYLCFHCGYERYTPHRLTV